MSGRSVAEAPCKKKGRRKPKLKLYANVASCHYPIIKKCLKAKGYVLQKDASLCNGKWDLLWADTNEFLREPLRLSEFQKVNHFPYMQDITRKDFLANNLNSLQKHMKEAFDFFPTSYCLPMEYAELNAAMSSSKKTFIVKPKSLSQGKGIRLTQSIKTISDSDPCVVQRYISQPLLIDGFKFDLRIYVLVDSIDPLKIYVYRNGLARLCTKPFVSPSKKNLADITMHLTNYAINKSSNQFVRSSSEDSGSKRSLGFVMRWLTENGNSSEIVWSRICQVIVKTILAIHPRLVTGYRSHFSRKSNKFGSACFEILGFDIMLDSKLKPWLIEVNDAPSFSGSSKLDKQIKTGLITSALEHVSQTIQQKRKFAADQKRSWAKRLWNPKPVRRIAVAPERSAASDNTAKDQPAVIPVADNQENETMLEMEAKTGTADDELESKPEVLNPLQFDENSFELCYPLKATDSESLELRAQYAKILTAANLCRSNVYG